MSEPVATPVEETELAGLIVDDCGATTVAVLELDCPAGAAEEDTAAMTGEVDELTPSPSTAVEPREAVELTEAVELSSSNSLTDADELTSMELEAVDDIA